MKFLHLSDLHIGKRVYGFSMLEDQSYILSRILEIAAGEKPEDKKRLDAEFAQTVKERQEKAAKLDKALSPWTYQVEKSVFDASAGTRDGFLKAKAKTEAPPATDPK